MARRMIHMPADTDLNHLFVVWTEAGKLLFQYGLTVKGWKIVFDNTKMRGGQCRYAQKEIGISAHLFAIWTYEQCIQIVLHEVAHALCPGHMHDKVWKAKAAEIGYEGSRCWDAKAQASYPRKKRERNWIGTCPNGHTRTRARAPLKGRRYSCGSCSPGAFDYRAEITWEEKVTNRLGDYDRSRFELRQLREQHELEARYRHLANLFPNVNEDEEQELDNLRDRLGYPDPFAESPAELRQRAAEYLAAEFGTDVSEWLV